MLDEKALGQTRRRFNLCQSVGKHLQEEWKRMFFKARNQRVFRGPQSEKAHSEAALYSKRARLGTGILSDEKRPQTIASLLHNQSKPDEADGHQILPRLERRTGQCVDHHRDSGSSRCGVISSRALYLASCTNDLESSYGEQEITAGGVGDAQ